MTNAFSFIRASFESDEISSDARLVEVQIPETEEALDQKLADQEKTLELAEAQSDVQAAEAGEAALESLIKNVTGFRDYAAKLKSEGREIDSQAQKYINRAVTNYRNAFGLKTSSLENLNSYEGVEHEFGQVAETLGEAMESLQVSRVKALTRVSKLLRKPSKIVSLEDLSEDEQQVLEQAQIDATTLTETQIAGEVEAQSNEFNAREDAADEIAEIAADVQHDSENGGISTEAIHFAHLAMESICTPFGIETPKLVRSLESLEPGKKYRVKSESLKAALEGSLVFDKYEGFWDSWQANLERGTSFVVTRTLFHKARIWLLMKRIKNSTAVGGSNVSINVKYLTRDGKTPNDIPDFIHDFAVWCRPFFNQWTKNAKDCFVSNCYALKECNGDAKLLKSKWKDPRDSIQNLKFPIPGSLNLFTDIDKTGGSGDPTIDFFMKKAYGDYPTNPSTFRKGGIHDPFRNGSVLVTVKSWSKEDIQKTTEAVRASLEQIEKLKSIVKAVTSNLKTGGGFAGIVWPVMFALRAAASPFYRRYPDTDMGKHVTKAFRTSRRLMDNVSYDVSLHFLHVSAAWINAANRSLNVG